MPENHGTQAVIPDRQALAGRIRDEARLFALLPPDLREDFTRPDAQRKPLLVMRIWLAGRCVQADYIESHDTRGSRIVYLGKKGEEDGLDEAICVLLKGKRTEIITRRDFYLRWRIVEGQPDGDAHKSGAT